MIPGLTSIISAAISIRVRAFRLVPQFVDFLVPFVLFQGLLITTSGVRKYDDDESQRRSCHDADLKARKSVRKTLAIRLQTRLLACVTMAQMDGPLTVMPVFGPGLLQHRREKYRVVRMVQAGGGQPWPWDWPESTPVCKPS